MAICVKNAPGAHSRHSYYHGRDAKSPSATRDYIPVKPRKSVPYEFVLEAVSQLPIETRSMFGCLAVYVGDKIVLILREKPEQ